MYGEDVIQAAVSAFLVLGRGIVILGRGERYWSTRLTVVSTWCSWVDGTAIDGLGIDGPADDGLAVEGPEVNGPADDGLAVDGPAVDGPAVDGPAVDGLAVDGPAADDPADDGLAVGGPADDGPADDGLADDGPAIDVPAVDGLAVDGIAVDSPAIHGLATAAVIRTSAVETTAWSSWCASLSWCRMLSRTGCISASTWSISRTTGRASSVNYAAAKSSSRKMLLSKGHPQSARLESVDGLVLSRRADVGCSEDTGHLVKRNALSRVGHHPCVRFHCVGTLQ